MQKYYQAQTLKIKTTKSARPTQGSSLHSQDGTKNNYP